MALNCYCAHEFCMLGIQKGKTEMLSSLCFAISVASAKRYKGRDLKSCGGSFTHMCCGWGYLSTGVLSSSAYGFVYCVFMWTSPDFFTSSGLQGCFFFMLKLELWVLGKMTTEVKWHLYHTISMVHILNMAGHWWC